MQSWTHRSVLITGASKGIGEATARHLAELGASVMLCARSGDELRRIRDDIKAAGGSAEAVVCDVTDPDAVQAAVQSTVETFGHVDVLVNNAGTIEPIGHLADTDPSHWGQAIDINIKGVYHGLHAAIPAMLDTGGGTIINLSSGAASSALEGWSAYCATKAAVLQLTRVAHEEYGQRGITVVGLSPGTVATPMQETIKESGVNPVSQMDWSKHIPPDWVAKAIAHLCGDAGQQHAGGDFSIKTLEGRAAVGLPPPD